MVLVFDEPLIASLSRDERLRQKSEMDVSSNKRFSISRRVCNLLFNMRYVVSAKLPWWWKKLCWGFCEEQTLLDEWFQHHTHNFTQILAADVFFESAKYVYLLHYRMNQRFVAVILRLNASFNRENPIKSAVRATHVKLRCIKEPRSTSLSCSVRMKSIVPITKEWERERWWNFPWDEWVSEQAADVRAHLYRRMRPIQCRWWHSSRHDAHLPSDEHDLHVQEMLHSSQFPKSSQYVSLDLVERLQPTVFFSMWFDMYDELIPAGNVRSWTENQKRWREKFCFPL